ncbi:MAG: radical SAM protein [Nanoarchaeota archaeon]|mgnify:CR=1 FL=1
MKLDKTTGEWKDWKWQERNAVRDVREVASYFTRVDRTFFDGLYEKSSGLKFQVTQYMLSQIPGDISLEELQKNPWFLQFFPLGDIYHQGPDAYNGTENWDMPEEFPTSNLQHKYTNRALVRFRNCLAYCNFCFEALGTLEKDPKPEKIFKWGDWEKSLEYLASRPEIEEVVLSGGEPLLLPDLKLEQVLRDISEIRSEDEKPKIRFKRIHTRVLSHNPYRVTDDLVKTLKDYRVNEIAFHIAHPSEITDDFREAIYRIREGAGRYAPILATHTPLLGNINASAEKLWELFGQLYELNIKPYYLIHTFPHTPFANQQRVSVKDGVKLMKQLKRHKSNIAIPEYIVAHYNGKITVPLELNGTPEFQYTKDEQGNPIVKFLNWKDRWVTYPDCEDRINS